MGFITGLNIRGWDPYNTGGGGRCRNSKKGAQEQGKRENFFQHGNSLLLNVVLDFGCTRIAFAATSPPLQKKSGAIKRQTSLSVSKEYTNDSVICSPKQKTPSQICKGVHCRSFYCGCKSDGRSLKCIEHTIPVYKYGVNNELKVEIL